MCVIGLLKEMPYIGRLILRSQLLNTACFDFPAGSPIGNSWCLKRKWWEMVRDKIFQMPKGFLGVDRTMSKKFVCSIYEIVDDSANRWSLDKKVKIVQFLLQWLRTSFRTSSYGNCVFPCAATCTDRRDTSVLFPINDLLLNKFWNDWTLDKF